MQSINTRRIGQWILCALILYSYAQANATPISWLELTSPGFVPRRSQEELGIYFNHLKANREQGYPPEIAVLMGVFGFTAEQAQKCVTEDSPEEYRLAVTSFPYWLEPNIIHLVAFSNKPDWNRNKLLAQTENLLKDHLPEVFQRDCFEYQVYINPPSSRSVKKLAHSHIFVRNIKQDREIFQLVSHLPFSSPSVSPKSWPVTSE